MIVALAVVDVERLAGLARLEAERYPARSTGRRTASHLWVALTVPAAAKSLEGARRAIASFGGPEVQADALDLFHRLAATAATPPATGE